MVAMRKCKKLKKGTSMKKLTIFGSLFVFAVLMGLAITVFLPHTAHAIQPCDVYYQHRTTVGDCTWKCPPGEIGDLQYTYAGYYVFYDGTNWYWWDCEFMGKYCFCHEDYIPHQE